jgi:hypothetical protein
MSYARKLTGGQAMKIPAKHILAVGLLLLGPVLKDTKAQSPVRNNVKPDAKIPFPIPRFPVGIYALVPIETVVAAAAAEYPTPADMDNYLTTSFYPSLLANGAVAGLAVQVHWSTLNMEAGSYSWNYLNDAFASVAAWNTENPTLTPKTIQLVVIPGFLSPPWVLSDLTSCDGLFESSPPGPGCGEVTFTNFREKNQADGNTTLPLPWSPTYQADWSTFLTALAAQFNAYTSLVSISVAGPTASSVEMILPAGTTDDETIDDMSFSANDMWDQLLTNAGLPVTPTKDEAFITAWGDAVSAFAGIFSGVTLVATPGSGLPNLEGGTAFKIPMPFGPDCMGTGGANLDCYSETTILKNFVAATAGGENGKATQTSGLEASSVGKNLGIAGVKLLTQKYMGEPSSSTRILGGAQFAMAVSVQPKNEGGSSSKVQALYNVLGVYFGGTPVAGSKEFFGGIKGSAPLNYLQIFYQDILYGISDTTKETVTKADGATVSKDFQDLLDLASQDLLEIQEGEPPNSEFPSTD